jgi:hypothetical protein
MARRRRKSGRGGASAPAHCKTALKSCLKSGPALSPQTGRSCFKGFNRCRSGRRGKRR